MRTTVELPDELLEAALSFANQNGKTFNEVLIESLELFLRRSNEAGSPPVWESLFGAFSDDPEIANLRQILDAEFPLLRTKD